MCKMNINKIERGLLQMKKAIKVIAVIMVIATVACIFAGCGNTLKGTYKSTGAVGGTLTFDKDNKVTGEAFGVSIGGTYEIKDGSIIFSSSTTFLGIGGTITKSFEKKGSSIYIDGTEFVKQ